MLISPQQYFLAPVIGLLVSVVFVCVCLVSLDCSPVLWFQPFQVEASLLHDAHYLAEMENIPWAV